MMSRKKDCKPKNEGGLGIRSLRKMNDVFMSFMRTKYNLSSSFVPDDLFCLGALTLWTFISRLWEIFRRNIRWVVGDGARATRF